MLFLPMEDKSVYTIGDIYAQNKHDNKMMLSPYPSDFWKPYRDNNGYFDRRFMTLFKSWYPYEQETDEGRESVADDFRYDVYAHLMANDKRYSELFRINTIPDNEAYSLTNNVDYTETYGETNGRDVTFNKGSQTDTEDNERTKGQQIDSEDLSATKGQQIDSEDLSATQGAQDIDTTNSKSAYNESTFTPTDKSEVEQGARTDTQDNERTYGSRTDTEDNERTYGQRIDSEDLSRTSGAREDTTEETGSKDYTLHKVGNIGVQTVDDMLLKHWDNWNLFDFYKMIFDEIARDLLRGC
jgi:hypothetical protein